MYVYKLYCTCNTTSHNIILSNNMGKFGNNMVNTHVSGVSSDLLLETFVAQSLYFNLSTGNIQSITAVTSDSGPDLGPVTTLSVPITPRRSRPLKIKATITDTGSRSMEATQAFKVGTR